MGGEGDVLLVAGGFEGDEVPGVGGDYICGDEVDLIRGVGDVVGTDGADVGVVAFAEGGLDLNAEEAAVVVDREVVGGVVSPGAGDAEAEFGGTGHETELRPLASGLGVADGHTFVWHYLFAPWFICTWFGSGYLRPVR